LAQECHGSSFECQFRYLTWAALAFGCALVSMPTLRAGDWVYDQGEVPAALKDEELRAENKTGHRPLESYNLPKWVYHPGQASQRILIEKKDFYGMAADGNRNTANWNVAHVAAYHDDLKLLSLATIEQCKEPNKWGMTPTHMCAMGQHPYGPSLAVLYELIQLGVADPKAVNHADQTPWHVCQRMHKADNVKKFEKVMFKDWKPPHYDQLRESQLKLRGKFGRPQGVAAPLAAVEDLQGALPTCLIFPGQGSQYVGMMETFKDLQSVKEMLGQAKDILGYDILDLMLKGPEEKLMQTEYCQPAMYIASLAAVEQLKVESPSQVEKCKAVAGFSLGELTALTVAGVFDFETGLRIVRARAEAMAHEVSKPGAKAQGMVSVAGLERDVVERLCQEVKTSLPDDMCQIANFMFPTGFSVAGTEQAVLAMQKKATDAGALQAKVVKTSGAFHTPMMSGAQDALVAELQRVEGSLKSPRCFVYMNTSAKSVGPSTPVKEIIKMLGEQLVSPVLWEQCMVRAIKDGCTKFYECGPSKQLKAMMKRIDPKMADKTVNILA